MAKGSFNCDLVVKELGYKQSARGRSKKEAKMAAACHFYHHHLMDKEEVSKTKDGGREPTKRKYDRRGKIQLNMRRLDDD